MELREFHQLVSTEPLVNLFYKIDETNCVYFKSKFNDLEFLAYGDFSQSLDIEDDSIYFFEGTFEENHHYLKFENYVLRFKNEYHIKLKDAPKLKNKIDQPTILERKEIVDQNSWFKMINEAHENMRNNCFEKIVLSRTVNIEFNTSPINLTEKLFTKNNQNYQIYKKINDKTFISLTPEMFLNINTSKNQLIVMALAGSMPKTSDEKLNNENQSYLLNNPKLFKEHQIVVDEIEKRLKSLSGNVEVSKLKIMELPYIYHREKTVQCTLEENYKLNEIIKLLHPTPAVGTMPYANGIDIIHRIEGKNREYYAAPIGIISKKIIDLAVGLRCALIEEKTMTLFSGCGVTIESDPKAEWEETENKLKPFLSVLNYE